MRKWLRKWLGIEDLEETKASRYTCSPRFHEQTGVYLGDSSTNVAYIADVELRVRGLANAIGYEWFTRPQVPAKSGWRKKKGGK